MPPVPPPRPGCGQGEDAKELDDKERAGWRQQALDWLRADLDLRTKQLDGGKPEDRKAAGYALRYWQADAALAGVRDAAELAKLPADEQEAWRKLWADVEALLKKDTGEVTAAPGGHFATRSNSPRPTTGAATTRPKSRHTMRAATTFFVPIISIHFRPRGPARKSRGANRQPMAAPKRQPAAPNNKGASSASPAPFPDAGSPSARTAKIRPRTAPKAPNSPPRNTIRPCCDT